MQKLTISLAVALLSVYPAAASASPTAREIVQDIEGSDSTSKMVASIAISNSYVGMWWANLAMESKTGKSLFCPPDHISLQPEQVASILRKYIEKRTDIGDKEFPMVLLHSMIDAFPCGIKE